MSEQAPKPERLPSYAISTVNHTMVRLVEHLLPRYAEIHMADPDALETLTRDLRRYLPAAVSRVALLESARVWLGRTPAAEEFREWLWMLAGNEDRLKKGIPVYRWRAPGALEWVPMQVNRVDVAPSYKNNETRYSLRLRVLAGTACPLTFEKRVTGAWMVFISRVIGFTRTYGHRPYLSPYQFYGMRFYGKLDPQHGRENLPGFSEVRCPSACMTYNREVLNRRYRRKGFQCPYEYTHDCHQCPCGFTQCRAATHKLDYYQALCTMCQETTWFDPEHTTGVCITCSRRTHLQGTGVAIQKPPVLQPH